MKLGFIEIDKLMLHECTEEIRFNNLKTKIEEEKIQKNPIIVTKVDDYYLVLDGAHRYSCIKSLNYKYILCQIVNSEEYYIDTWNHIISKNDYSNYIQPLLENEEYKDLNFKKDKNTIKINVNSEEMSYELLNRYTKFVDFLNKCASFKRIHNEEYCSDSVKIMYPEVNKDLIKLLVNKNTRIPAGISKVNLKCGRILGVSIPLFLLNENSFHKSYIDKIMKNLRKYEETIHLYEGMLLEYEIK
ncbi:ParB N-terminal domain-containing protein [Macrococcus bovicus]|uniref:ParB N-terminal domain-containing protein n=1 Tax=Macrococcus bovicus TaxID=69968 RepID=UPI0025A5CFAD|nr:ParB N-terminal domain-containing protein [Macrococcus bovicus]WJP96766.1 ParB N-terminal domain-containing protein [Macrococcus bovicus]